MRTRGHSLHTICIVCTLVCLITSEALAQSSADEFHRILREKAALDAVDFAALEQGQTIVKLTPITDKREVALAGVVSLHTSADEFLRSYLDGLTRTNAKTVLEAGRFGSVPAVADLQQLTIEPADIEDLKECVVGDCELKLSAKMIERFRREVDWEAPDYAIQATELLKTMLVDYVRDYLARGPAALIEYSDKRNEVRVADEQQALSTASGYLNDLLRDPRSGMRVVEEAIFWSKIKFGLKPVLVINHVRAYKNAGEFGPQVLVAANQLYANHYFNSSLALAGFVNVPGANPAGYLVYENRSRADGLTGPFSKIKRGVIQGKSVEGLKSILEHSKSSLEGSALAAADTSAATYESPGWGRRLFGGVRAALWVMVISALLALVLLGRRRVAKPARPTQRRADIRT